jgi:hypothetical protein
VFIIKRPKTMTPTAYFARSLLNQLKRVKLPYCLAVVVLVTMTNGLQAQHDDVSRTLDGLNVEAKLEPAKNALLRIDLCRANMIDVTLRRRFTQVEESLVVGLLIGWSPGWLKQSPDPHYVRLQDALVEARGRKIAVQLTPPPARYLASLDDDAALCQAAFSNQHESKDAARALVNVIDDLNLKFRDCYLHGMGRLILMSVATEKNNKPDAGWTVYFKWITVSDIRTTETAFRTTSTPATDDLPPGIYQLRAQKKDPSSGVVLKSETKTVPLDGARNSCELQVP